MTQEELEKGADAVEVVAQKHGLAAWVNRDQLREIAAAVITALDGMRKPSGGKMGA